MVAQARRYHVALVDPLPAGLEILNPELAVTEAIPQDNGGNTPVVEYGSRSYGRTAITTGAERGLNTKTSATNAPKRSRLYSGKAFTNTPTLRGRRHAGTISSCRPPKPRKCITPKPSGARERIL